MLRELNTLIYSFNTYLLDAYFVAAFGDAENLALQLPWHPWVHCQNCPGWCASMSPHLGLLPGLQILCLQLE